MTKMSYKDAVKAAKKFIEANRFKDGQDQFCQKLADPRLAITVGNTVSKMHIIAAMGGLNGKQKSPPDEPDYPEDYLIQAAKEDWRAFDGLRQSLASKMNKNEHIPQLYWDWIADYLRGEIVAPSKKLGNKRKDAGHSIVREAVSLLVKHGFRPYHNAATGDSGCGCSAVAEAMGQLGLTPNTYDSVAKVRKATIWLDL